MKNCSNCEKEVEDYKILECKHCFCSKCFRKKILGNIKINGDCQCLKCKIKTSILYLKKNIEKKYFKKYVFKCRLFCNKYYPIDNQVILSCDHKLCRNCIIYLLNNNKKNETNEFICPFEKCEEDIENFEIKCLECKENKNFHEFKKKKKYYERCKKCLKDYNDIKTMNNDDEKPTSNKNNKYDKEKYENNDKKIDLKSNEKNTSIEKIIKLIKIKQIKENNSIAIGECGLPIGTSKLISNKDPDIYKVNSNDNQENLADTLPLSKNIPKNFETKNKFNNELTKKCLICLGNNDEKDMINLECKHYFCSSCLTQYFQNKIESKQASISNMICPVCKKSINYEFLKKILSKELFDKYDVLIAEECIQKELNNNNNNSSNIYCPNKNCSKLNLINQNYSYCVCYYCNFQFCVSCYLDWKIHTGLTCKEVKFKLLNENEEENKLNDLIRKEKLKKCPFCYTLIEKTKFCNYIRCESSICKKKNCFCYICGEALEENQINKHYIDGNTYNDCIKTIKINKKL